MHRLLAFITALVALVSGVSLVSRVANIDLMALGPVYMFSPLAAAVVVCYVSGLRLQTVGLRLGNWRWSIIAAVMWPPITLVIAGVSLLAPGVWFDPSLIVSETGVPHTPLWLLIGFLGLTAFTMLMGVTLNAVFAFGEEFGWRGYLLWELAPLGFWKASILIGAVWGLWHAPLVAAGLNYPSFPILGIAVFTLVCIVVSPIFTYVVLKGRSVLPAVFLHGVFNAISFAALAQTDSDVLRELVASEGGLAGLVVFTGILWVMWHAGTPEVSEELPTGGVRG